jgi:hypothetical protein
MIALEEYFLWRFFQKRQNSEDFLNQVIDIPAMDAYLKNVVE